MQQYGLIKCIMANLVLCCITLAWFHDDSSLWTETCGNIQCDTIIYGDRGSTVVKVLCYNSEGLWFNPSWCQWIFR